MIFPFLRPYLPSVDEWSPLLEISYEQKYFSNFGPLATTLADRMSEAYLGDGYEGVLCTSNTAGLVAVLQTLDVLGKKVAIPDFTFAATPQAVFAAGATPVVCDIDADTWELSAESLSEALQAHPDIAAVIHVRPFGLIRDISAVRDVCRAHDVPLMVDAAAGLAGPSDEVVFGSDAGEIEVFSLHATKVFAIGEGGFIAAPAGRLPALKSAMNFGFHPDRTYGEGQNAKIDEFRAAIGMVMLDKMDDVVAVRRRHAAFYDTLFETELGLPVAVRPGKTPWSTYPVIFDKPVTQETLGIFADNGIEIKKYYWPGVIKGYVGPRTLHAMDTPNSFALQDRCACFPVYSDFTDDMGTRLAERVRASLHVVATKGG